MPAEIVSVLYRVQGAEIPDDEAEVTGQKEIMATIENFFYEAQTATEEDGETREVVILVRGDGEEPEEEEEGDEN